MHARGSRLIERCQDAIKPTSIDRPAIEHLSRGQKVARLIDLAIKRCRDCDKENQLKNSTDRLGIERCRDCLKTIFQKWKNTNMNAISMQLNQGSNQHFKFSKSSLNNNFKHIDPKNTHTHTLNKSNQFYIS